jgi:hypothetical protein
MSRTVQLWWSALFTSVRPCACVRPVDFVSSNVMSLLLIAVVHVVNTSTLFSVIPCQCGIKWKTQLTDPYKTFLVLTRLVVIYGDLRQRQTGQNLPEFLPCLDAFQNSLRNPIKVKLLCVSARLTWL